MKWNINIDNFIGGLAPAFWTVDYPSYGNKNQAGKLQNVDLTNPSHITQGPGLANLINGTQAGIVNTLIKGILETPSETNITYAVGKDKFYKLTSTEVISDADFPHLIKKVKSTILKSPASNKEVDGYTGWTNGANAYTSDDTYATSSQDTPKFHVWHNFGLSIPSGAIIKGIEVYVEAKASGPASTPQILLYLTKNKNDIVGSYKNTNILSGSDTISVLGGPNELWSGTWSSSDFGTDFGVTMVAGNTNTTPPTTYSIDHIQIKVYYVYDEAGDIVEGEDTALYQGNVYYSYNTDIEGNVGRYAKLLWPVFVDNWAATMPASGAIALQKDVPHPLLSAGNDILYIGNKNYVSSYDGENDIFTEKDLDLPVDCVIQDLVWASKRIWIATNRPNITGDNKNIASIYIWDSSSSSWEDEVAFTGRIGALFVKNGIVFAFYQDISSIGGYKLGYVSGNRIEEIASFTGSLPSYYQVIDYKNFITWVSSGQIWGWGSIEKNIPTLLFQLADCGYSTVGGLASPFGTLMVASTEGVNYRLAKFSGYDVNCYWYSLLFDITGNARKSLIDKIKFNFEKLTVGARIDWILRDNNGTSLGTGTISFTEDGAITTKDFYPQCEAENFRIELNFANGSIVNPILIKNISIYGHTL